MPTAQASNPIIFHRPIEVSAVMIRKVAGHTKEPHVPTCKQCSKTTKPNTPLPCSMDTPHPSPGNCQTGEYNDIKTNNTICGLFIIKNVLSKLQHYNFTVLCCTISSVIRNNVYGCLTWLSNTFITIDQTYLQDLTRLYYLRKTGTFQYPCLSKFN